MFIKTSIYNWRKERHHQTDTCNWQACIQIGKEIRCFIHATQLVNYLITVCSHQKLSGQYLKIESWKDQCRLWQINSPQSGKNSCVDRRCWYRWENLFQNRQPVEHPLPNMLIFIACYYEINTFWTINEWSKTNEPNSTIIWSLRGALKDQVGGPVSSYRFVDLLSDTHSWKAMSLHVIQM